MVVVQVLWARAPAAHICLLAVARAAVWVAHKAAHRAVQEAAMAVVAASLVAASLEAASRKVAAWLCLALVW